MFPEVSLEPMDGPEGGELELPTTDLRQIPCGEWFAVQLDQGVVQFPFYKLSCDTQTAVCVNYKGLVIQLPQELAVVRVVPKPVVFTVRSLV